MKLNILKKKMRKPVFTLEEARRVAWETAPSTLKLQLHQWVKAGELIRLKRGVYGFPEQVTERTEVARALYGPAYLSLEYALNAYGLLPEAVFALTLVTPRLTRRFVTPVGTFIYHKIKRDLFWGYDPRTLMGEQEKVLVDYCYINGRTLVPEPTFWKTLRFQNLHQVNFKKAKDYARRTGSRKVVELVRSLEAYRRNHGRS